MTEMNNMRDENDLYKSVVKNSMHGFFELAKEYRKTMESFYKDKYYQDNHALYHKTEYDDLDIAHKNHFYAQKLYVLEKLGGYLSQERYFLDVGTGEGYALSFFDNNGWEVMGIDYSAYGIEAHNPAMKRYLKQGDFYEIVTELQREGKTFDFINADNVLEHLPEPEEFFDRLSRISHKGTVVCVTVPNDFSIIQKLAFETGHIAEPFWVTKDTSEHFSYFSVDSLCSLGSVSGYEKILATSDWPIDYFLLHDNTNYRKNSNVGHDCHVACTLLENRLYEESITKAVNLFQALAEAGIGREISVYFKFE